MERAQSCALRDSPLLLYRQVNAEQPLHSPLASPLPNRLPTHPPISPPMALLDLIASTLHIGVLLMTESRGIRGVRQPSTANRSVIPTDERTLYSSCLLRTSFIRAVF
jgi:hypothetical protein